jgi:hypothetical protein
MRVQELKRQLETATYAVDSAAVAGAILSRPSARHLLLAEPRRMRGDVHRPRRRRPRSA